MKQMAASDKVAAAIQLSSEGLQLPQQEAQTRIYNVY